jgi:hypothetical protein
MVVVTNGVYSTGGRAVFGTMTNRVAVDRPALVQSVNGPAVTIIQGYQVPGMTNGNGAIRCVYLTNSAVLSGFTLTNGATRSFDDSGFADLQHERTGGGVWCESASALVTNCTLTGNSSFSYGGGVYQGTLNNCTVATNSSGDAFDKGSGGGAYSATLNNCTLSFNTAGNGGGASGSILSRCTLLKNSAVERIGGGEGGGAYQSTLRDCIVAGNSALYGGGTYGSTLFNSTVTSNRSVWNGGGATGSNLYNCVVWGNRVERYGGGVDGATLYNCTVVGNAAEYYGGGAYSSTLYNCIIYYNSAGYDIPNVSGTVIASCFPPPPDAPQPLTNGNITNAPAFVDLQEGNFHLLPTSPCIDAGTDLSAVVTNDLDGNPRPLDGNGDSVAAFDMGAYEFIPGTPPAISVQPRSRTNVVSSALMLSVTATGSEVLTYQWFKDEMAISGATGRILVLANVQPGDAGTYHVTVSNFVSSVTSSNAVLTVVPLEPPSVIAGPIVNPANGHQYYLLGQSTWVEAEAAAHRLIGHLVTLRNAAEQQWVFTNFSTWGGQERILWIGLHDADPVNNSTNSLQRRAEFVWSSGEPVTYANWSAVEPNNYRERGEYYVHTLPPSDPSEPGAWVDAWDVDFNGRPLHGVAEVVPIPIAMTHYVNAASATPTTPYLTWETAAHTIQDAVDAAEAGDVVLVTNGVYSTGGKVVFGTLNNRVAIDKAIEVRSVNGPQVTAIVGGSRCAYVATNAILSGFTLADGFTQDSGDPIKERSGGGAWVETSGLLTNCVIVHNQAYHQGGGVYGGTLRNCIITNNQVINIGTGWGGGLSGSTLYECTVVGNRVNFGDGGGVSESTLYDCRVERNSATHSGGGAIASALYRCTLSGNSVHAAQEDAYGGGASSCLLYECILSGNFVESPLDAHGGGAFGGTLYSCMVLNNSVSARDVVDGGGVSHATVDNSILSGNGAGASKDNVYGGGASSSILRNCLLVGNAAGGGHYAGQHPEVLGGGAAFCTLSNCTVAGNTASDELQAARGGGVGGSTLQNCIVFNNSAPTNSEYAISTVGSYQNSTFSYSCTTPLPDAGIGNITNAPAFVNPAAGDYHLAAGSPCIDAAYNLSGVITNDLDGYPRPLDGNADGIAAYDMGAYEFTGGAVHYVNAASATPTTPYLTWETAAHTIQDAVDAAHAGEIVLVTNGVYATGGRAVVGTMTNRVAVDKPLTLQSVNGLQFTVIQGYQVPGTTNGDGAIRCVYLTNGARLCGFTLTNGATRTSGDLLAEQSGGGVWCEAATVLVSNCVVAGSVGWFHGGGAYGGGTFFNCTFTDNWAGFGGGVGGQPSADGWATLYDCILTGNWAYGDGGGARNSILYNCSLMGNSAARGGGTWGCTLYSCTVKSNSAVGLAGGLISQGGGASSGTLSNCTLIGNSASEGGGAWQSTLEYCTLIGNHAGEGGGTHSGTVSNCTLLFNTASSGGGIAWSTVYSSILTSNKVQGPPGADLEGAGAYRAPLYNSLLLWNSGWGIRAYNCTFVGAGVAPNDGIHVNTLVNCIVPGNPEVFDSWQNCFNGDPKFVDPLAGDYHLRQDSPCVDAGAYLLPLGIVLTTDLDGKPRALDGNGDGVIVPDIGAYEFDLRTVVPTSWFLSYGLDPNNPYVAGENPDGDAYTTYQEWLADTNPTNAQSFFHIEAITASSPVTIYFQSSSNRLYTLRYTTNIQPTTWTNVPGQIDVPGNGGMDSLTDATNDTPKFYRLGVRVP